jgi:hypothetical protein
MLTRHYRHSIKMVKNADHVKWLDAEYEKFPRGVAPTESAASLAQRCNEACGTIVPTDKVLGIRGNMVEASVVAGYVLKP